MRLPPDMTQLQSRKGNLWENSYAIQEVGDTESRRTRITPMVQSPKKGWPSFWCRLAAADFQDAVMLVPTIGDSGETGVPRTTNWQVIPNFEPIMVFDCRIAQGVQKIQRHPDVVKSKDQWCNRLAIKTKIVNRSAISMMRSPKNRRRRLRSVGLPIFRAAPVVGISFDRRLKNKKKKTVPMIHCQGRAQLLTLYHPVLDPRI
ncbi:unnamed protein product [Nesidiocoris tenuis]|uniref:Uncharacterized protein n=1 Tax=Nesidiocoris tenuis TaxID=355587 RepID=A0A6H5FV38_9HEMI|nr:unnamed protein product [Nesidiocoris tenuis]